MYASTKTDPDEMREVGDDTLVTADGRVFHRSTEGMRPKDCSLRDGYPTVSLRLAGKHTSRGVHQLVMQAFGPPKPSPKHIIRHRDGDSLNTHISNLRWGTHGENKEDDRLQGKTNTFRRAGRSRTAQVYLSENELRQVIELANKHHVPVSTFIRLCLLDAILKETDS